LNYPPISPPCIDLQCINSSEQWLCRTATLSSQLVVSGVPEIF
jgi:hypothetical protein